MRTFGPQLFFFLLLLAAAITLACGSPTKPVLAACNSAPTAVNGQSPESVILCPPSADANDYPDGLVQFVAIGNFSSPPSPALPEYAMWGACQDKQFTSGVTVSSKGVAQCASGASGTYTVWATAGPVVCLVVGPCGDCGPTGSAQLTCP